VGAQTEDRLISCLEAEYPQCQAVVVTDFAGGTLTPRVIASLVQLQKQHRRILAINARSCNRFREAGVTVLKASYREAASLLGLPVLTGTQRIDQLKSHGPRLLEVTSTLSAAVTLDSDGTVLIDATGKVRHVPSLPLPETLTSGASDTFLAVLSLGLAASGSLTDAGQLANAATSVVARSLFKRVCRPKELIEAIQPTPSDGEHSAAMQYMQNARKRGQTVVLTTGCFDVLHRGHIAFLRQARRLGNILVVGVRSDETIRKLKGPDRPLNPLDDRIGVLASLDCVDHVVPFEEDTPERLISEICPDVFVKAGDDPRKRVPEAELVERLGGRVVLLPYLAGRSINLKIEQIRNGADVESHVSETDDSDPMMERTFRSTVI
jgi:D-beta-D-heptose 7-phosphate kinase/D-beta-D-heptose 1-phosphate adenosyltransferase